jgi:hypothetical protein
MPRGGRLLLSILLALLLRLPACPSADAQAAQAAEAAQPSRAADKALHFLFGASCALLVSAAAAPALRDGPRSDLGYALCVSGAGLGAAVCGGGAKELLDLTGFGNPEWADLLATAAGGLAASAAVLAAAGSDREARLAPVYASFGIALALPPAGGLLRRLGLRASRCGS